MQLLFGDNDVNGIGTHPKLGIALLHDIGHVSDFIFCPMLLCTALDRQKNGQCINDKKIESEVQKES